MISSFVILPLYIDYFSNQARHNIEKRRRGYQDFVYLFRLELVPVCLQTIILYVAAVQTS